MKKSILVLILLSIITVGCQIPAQIRSSFYSTFMIDRVSKKAKLELIKKIIYNCEMATDKTFFQNDYIDIQDEAFKEWIYRHKSGKELMYMFKNGYKIKNIGYRYKYYYEIININGVRSYKYEDYKTFSNRFIITVKNPRSEYEESSTLNIDYIYNKVTKKWEITSIYACVLMDVFSN